MESDKTPIIDKNQMTHILLNNLVQEFLEFATDVFSNRAVDSWVRLTSMSAVVPTLFNKRY